MTYAISITQTGGPEVLERSDVALPSAGNRQVVIRNVATAVNFIDTLIRRGEMPDGMMPDLPHVPGVEGAGVIESLGSQVGGLSVGDRVAWMGPIGAGGYAKHSIVDADCVTPIAESVEYANAAAIPVNAMTAWHMLVNLGRAKAGDSVLIHAAAGGVGTLAIQIAKHLEMTVFASVSTSKMDYARKQGADYVIDYRRENIVNRIQEMTNGRGVDLSLNPISGESLKGDLDALAPFGTAVIFGFLAGLPAGTFADDLVRHFQKSVAVRVSDIYSYFFDQPKAFNVDLKKVLELLGQDVLRPHITTLPISRAAEAHHLLESGDSKGKLVLTID